MSRNKVESIATTVLSCVQPEALIGECPTDIESIFEFYIPKKFGIRTGCTDLSSLGSGILGYTDAANKVSYVDKTLYDSDNKPTIRRCRATIGHEVFHCIQHVPILNFFKSTSFSDDHLGLNRMDQTKIRAFENPEWQAWEGCMSILMPKRLIIEYRGRGYDEYDMAEAFDVNPAFVKVRLAKLKIETP